MAGFYIKTITFKKKSYICYINKRQNIMYKNITTTMTRCLHADYRDA